MRILYAALFAAFLTAPAFAYTDEQVTACTPDVMRLCSAVIPDESLITKCMLQKKKQISIACLVAFRPTSSVSKIAAK